MAEVEQVYVWADSDWIPVVTEGDATLPISSEDGTVVIDSPAADAFTVDTEGETRLLVRSSSSDQPQLVVGSNPPGFQGGATVGGIHVQGSTGTELKFTYDAIGHGATSGSVIAYGSNGYTFRDRNEGGGFLFTINPSGLGGTAFNALKISGYDGKFILGQSGSVAAPALTFADDLNTGISRTGEDEISLITNSVSGLKVTTEASIFYGRLQSDFITTEAAAVNDAEIQLDGKELKFSADDIQANFDYVPQTDSSLTDKKYVNSRIVTLTQAEYDALGDYDPHVMYCISG